MCIISETIAKNTKFMGWYTFSVWIIGLLVLIYFCFELVCIQNIFGICPTKMRRKRCKLKFPAAFVMISLSLLSSFSSSTLFLYSTYNSSACLYAPIPAIILRFLSKHFIWAFNIVRGQMVIEMLENKYLNKFVKYSQYILTIQMIVIMMIVLIFSKSKYNDIYNHCEIEMPLIIIISIIFVGEILYGIGFVYIFFKAMTTSMKRVMDALRYKERQKTKKQLFHHSIIYFIQFILSSFYMISIITCSNSNTFSSFDIFEIELLINNILIMTLLRGRTKWFKKHCLSSPIKQNVELKMSKIYFQSTNISNTKNKEIINQINTDIEIKYDDDDYDEDDDIIREIPKLNLSEKDDELSSPTMIRNNSISMNPLLPNSWLSPRSIQSFKNKMKKKEELESILFEQNKLAFSTSDLNQLIELKTESEPIFECSLPKNPEQISKKSQSTSILDKRSNFEREQKQKENEERNLNVNVISLDANIVRSKSLIIDNEENNNNFNLSDASKNLFKKATKLFSTNIDSHSMPYLDDLALDDLASVEPITAILAKQTQQSLNISMTSMLCDD